MSRKRQGVILHIHRRKGTEARIQSKSPLVRRDRKEGINMENKITIMLRAFPCEVKDQRTGATICDTLVLSREQLRAAEMCGMGSKGLIHSFYNRKGYRVVSVGEAIRKAVTVDLWELFHDQIEEEASWNE